MERLGIDIYVHNSRNLDEDSGLSAQLSRIERLLIRLIQEEDQFMSDMKTELANLTQQVQANTDAEAAATQLINGIADRITAAAGDPAQVTLLASQLKTSAAQLSAAVVANTPAA